MAKSIELVELNSKKHLNLKVLENADIVFASSLHAMNLRVIEVGTAVSSFPVFLTRSPKNGEWVIIALTSFETGKNLFAQQHKWSATYKPICMQTYPLYLMQSPNDNQRYTMGINESDTVFVENEGTSLFDEAYKATPYLHQKTKLLEADIKHDKQTYEFTQHIDKLGLIKEVYLLVHYENGSVQTIKGLHTIDEDKLQSLSSEHFYELNQKGYLSSIYALLLSIYQLNLLVNKNNANTDFLPVKNIKLEISRAEYT